MSESFYIDKLANIGVEIEAAGKKFKVTQITMRHQGALQAVLRELFPKPSEQAKSYVRGLPDSVAAQVINEAFKRDMFWPQPVASSDGINMLMTSEKGQRLLFLSACQQANNWTEEEADKVFINLNAMEMGRIALIAIAGEDLSNDPKAMEPTHVTSPA